MYHKILITLDTTPTDRAIIEHIKQLAKSCGGSVVLFHVADGWAARKFGEDAVTTEIPDDQAYLNTVQKEFQDAGIAAQTALAFGDPKKEIIKWVEDNGCDLLAMSTHGHRLIGDLVLGNTASHVQHRLAIPVLMLRAK